MDEIKAEGAAREPYEAPVIEDVPLRADEQLLTGCKSAPTAAGRTGQCGACFAPRGS